MEFTTKQRRELTSGIIKQDEIIESVENSSNVIKSSLSLKIDDDKSNRELFLSINSEISGLTFEYGFITGFYKPYLDIKDYEYIIQDDNGSFIEKSYTDSPELQSAASLEEGNEFFKNLIEGSSDFLPTHPEKYSRWIEDNEEDFVLELPITEQEYFDTIKNSINWYNNGGVSGLEQDLTIYNNFRYIEDFNTNNFMTVGFTEYLINDPVYMSDGYNPNGDIVFINRHDENNCCLAKIVNSKNQPARILIAPYFIKGDVPDDAILTSVHNAGNLAYVKASVEMILELEKKYLKIDWFLKNNPNKSIENESTQNSITIAINFINEYKSGDQLDISRILNLISNLENLRIPTWSSRIEYIKNYLSGNNNMYENRFKVIDLRISKRVGTLREVMRLNTGITEIGKMTEIKKQGSIWFKEYFISKKCERDGDFRRRVFVIDNDNDFLEGDEVYLLSDKENIPEIKAEIDVIVDARLDDPSKTIFIKETGEIIKTYYQIKKIFIKNAVLEDNTPIKKITDDYKVLDNFRIIKQLQ